MAFFLNKVGLKNSLKKGLGYMLPGVPTGLVASNINQNDFQLDWTVADKADSYRVETSPTGTGTWTDRGNTSSTTLIVTGLDQNTTYDVRVISINSAGENISNLLVVTTSNVIMPEKVSVVTDDSYPTTTSQITLNFSWPATADTDSYDVLTRNELDTSWVIGLGGNDITATSHSFNYIDSYGGRWVEIKIRSTNANGYTESDVYQFTLPCVTPSSFVESAVGTTTVDVAWGASTRATGYQIFQFNGTGWDAIGGVQPTTPRTYQITGLSEGTNYRFHIVSIYSTSTAPNGYSSVSMEVDITTSVAAPAIPTGFYHDVATQGSDRYMLRWNQADSGHEYQVDRRVQGAGTWDIGIQGTIAELVQFIDNASYQGASPDPIVVNPNTIYENRLRAKFTNSAWSDWTGIVTAQTYPAIPSEPTLNTRTITSITVNIDLADCDTVDVGWRVAGTGDPLTTVTGLTATPYEITGLSQEEDYEIFQQKVNERGTLGWSAALNASTRPYQPNSPINLAASDIGKTSLTLSWANGGGVVDTYDVEYKLSSEPTVWTSWTNTASTSTSITGLTQETSYDFRVRANNVTGSSGWSNILTESTIGTIYLYPTADVSNTGWTSAPLWSKVNDQSDATFIVSSSGTGDTCTIQITNNSGTMLTNPILYVRRRKTTGGEASTAFDISTPMGSYSQNVSDIVYTTIGIGLSGTMINGSMLEVTLTRSGGGNPGNRRNIEVTDMWIEG